MKAVAINALTLKVTKRNDFSVLSSVFDPYIEVLSFCNRLLLRKICLTKTDWDEKILENLSKDWQKILCNRSTLRKFTNNRPYFKHVTSDPVVLYGIHGFCDASPETYGLCVHIFKNSSSIE